ncbi:histidine kinase [Halorarum halophilum]|uniref:Histidine kinase n=1 Tax=Halorarum halophilum TaxID=2743090 RepID=A0A7D5GCT4_9EURY|nr:histidine kinase [Halobaculum halophilum]QLG28472.1 histidine kinase [Halobaculum halophilum]
MATDTRTQPGVSTENTEWRGGVVAGLAGGAAMGVLLSMMMTPVIEVAIPSMYGLTGGLAGWVIHMAHAAVLGVGFAALAQATDIRSTAKSIGVGVAYGVVIWVALAVLLMPLWLSAVGSPANPPFPNLNPMSLVGHVVYGAVVGATFPAVRNL